MKRLLILALALALCLASMVVPGATSVAESGEMKVLRVGIANAGRGEATPEKGNEYIDDNYSTRYIIENWAKPNNIDLRFEVIDDTSDSATQNYVLMLASETAPDLFRVSVGEGSSWVRKQAMDDMLYDLRPSLEQYGENIISFLGWDFIDRYGTVNDQVVTIPGKEPIPAISHSWMRKDWLDILGLEVPTNFDEWYAAIVAFKENAQKLQDAGAIKDANAIVPYGMYHTRYFTDWERIVTAFYPVETFDYHNLAYYLSGYGIEYNKEGFKEGMKFMNQMYKDGLISPNFALDAEQDVFERDIVQGNTGCYVNNLFSGWGPSDPESWHNLSKANVGAEWVFIDCFTNKYDGQYRNPLDTEVLNYSFVPWFSKAADEAVQYLNFCWDAKENLAIQYGVEGQSYEMTDIGPMLYTDEQANANGWFHYLGANELVMIGRAVDDSWARIKRSGAKTLEEATYAEKIHKRIEENGYERFPIELYNVETWSTYVSGMRDTWTQFTTNLIMAESDEAFEQAWNSGVADLEAIGSQKVIDAITEYYNTVLKPELDKDNA